jgi:hypothetical protein
LVSGAGFFPQKNSNDRYQQFLATSSGAVSNGPLGGDLTGDVIVFCRRAHCPLILLATAWAAASLWDFRFSGLRPFDAIALVSIFGFIVLTWTKDKKWPVRGRPVLPLFVVFITYCVFGYIDYQHRSSVAMIVLSMVGLYLIVANRSPNVSVICKWLCAVHIIAYLTQIGVYYILGYTIDFHQMYGAHSRLYFDSSFRGAGLFQEPNSYCLNLFVLAAMAIFVQQSRPLAIFASMSMMLSQSLWGVAAALLLIVLNEVRQVGPIPRRVIMGATAWLVMLLVFNAYLWTVKPARLERPDFYNRLVNFRGDTSMHDRYLANGSDIQSCPNCKSFVERTPALNIPPIVKSLIGDGLSTQVFINKLPANGMAFLFNSFGLIGLMLLAGCVFLALRGLLITDSIFIVISVGFSFTTYPLITYVQFWLWLPTLLYHARERTGASGLAQPPR